MASNPYTTIHINTGPTVGTSLTTSDVQGLKDAAKEAFKTESSTSTEPTSSPLHKAQTLVAPATLLPPEALAQKAKSSKTTSNADEAVVTKVGPETVKSDHEDGDENEGDTDTSDDDSDGKKKKKTKEKKDGKLKSRDKEKRDKKSNKHKDDSSDDDVTSSSSSEEGDDKKKTKKNGKYAHLMPKTPKKKDRKKMLPMLPINKNGYVKKGFELDGTRTSDKEDGGSPRDRITLRQGEEREKYGGKGKKREVDGEDKKPELYHVHEMTMSHTVEKLEDGGKRTVWVRTDRNITVLIEDAKTVKEKEEWGKGKTVSRGFRGMKMGGVLGVPRALKSTTMMKERRHKKTEYDARDRQMMNTNN